MQKYRKQRMPAGLTDRPFEQVVNKPKTNHGDSALFSKGGIMAKKFPFMGKESAAEERKEGKKMPKFASGGYVRAADGIAKKGKTKGTNIAMKRGGKC